MLEHSHDKAESPVPPGEEIHFEIPEGGLGEEDGLVSVGGNVLLHVHHGEAVVHFKAPFDEHLLSVLRKLAIEEGVAVVEPEPGRVSADLPQCGYAEQRSRVKGEDLLRRNADVSGREPPWPCTESEEVGRDDAALGADLRDDRGNIGASVKRSNGVKIDLKCVFGQVRILVESEEPLVTAIECHGERVVVGPSDSAVGGVAMMEDAGWKRGPRNSNRGVVMKQDGEVEFFGTDLRARTEKTLVAGGLVRRHSVEHDHR